MNQSLAALNQFNMTFDGYLGELTLPGVDWQYFIERRKATLQQEPDLPAYLLLPEVEQLLVVTKDQTRHFLLNTLFHTGARISEVLALTKEDFHLDGKYPEISIQSAKQGRGRPSEKAKKRAKRRLIPVLDGDYIDEALRYFATNKGAKKAPLFTVTRKTAYCWIKDAVKALNDEDVELSIDVTPHTIRHSFAVNSVLHWVPVPVLQSWLGHENREMTEIYTRIFQTETVHFMGRVEYKSGLIK